MKLQVQAQQTAKTAREVREEFERHGISITKWATERGFDDRLVRDVLLGRCKGKYGKSHEIAVALGLKPKPGKPPEFLRREA